MKALPEKVSLKELTAATDRLYFLISYEIPSFFQVQIFLLLQYLKLIQAWMTALEGVMPCPKLFCYVQNAES